MASSKNNNTAAAGTTVMVAMAAAANEAYSVPGVVLNTSREIVLFLLTTTL